MSKKKKQKLDLTPYEDRAQLCPCFGLCGGCTYQKISYEKQLAIKSEEVEKLLRGVYPDFRFEGIVPSPSERGYRNKMEFTFGDTCKDGPFALGLHQKGSFMNIVDIRECILVHPDMNKIRNAVRDYFAALYESGQIDFKNNKTQRGYLRHLLLRRAAKTGEILVALVTTSPEKSDVPEFAVFSGQGDEPEFAALSGQGDEPEFAAIKARREGADLPKLSENPYEEHVLYGFLKHVMELEEVGSLEGRIAGVLHITNDALSDVVQSDRTTVLYGSEFINEEVLGLQFKISPFSFFQTNTLGAELLYEKAREYAAAAGTENKKTDVLFDLYSGTGTITQLMAPAAKKVIGVEIVEEAVRAAKENAAFNGIENVSFIAGDVLKVLDELPKPDAIILDPPREGINPKALGKILAYGVEHLVYVSCKPTSLARDLESFRIAGYDLVKACCVDMFPQTPHVETVVLLCRKAEQADRHIVVNYEPQGKHVDKTN